MSENRPTNGSGSPPAPEPQGDEPIADSAYIAMHSDPRFVSLKKRLYTFIFPMSVAFLAWYVLYVFMSGFGRDIMSTVLFGNVNVALVFGLLQFVSTFGIAILYTRYARKSLDKDAVELRDELQNGHGGGGR
ncbi:DUF485 domain-containing protein [Nocardiopsis salina]|uniref:DUF485 domain-containing protein n=1 Tax=Nocardiopsis salina TaxID=245836 RepID=UPI00034D92F6|nr:DUF485 domain-containing protein [Nocardiopsis salina]